MSWSRKQGETGIAGREKPSINQVLHPQKHWSKSCRTILDEKYDAIYLAHNRFVNALTQKPVGGPYASH